MAGADADEEADIEGLARSGHFLWAVGSHSLRRKQIKARHTGDKALKRLAGGLGRRAASAPTKEEHVLTRKLILGVSALSALALLVGVAAALVVYWVLNKLAEALPGRWENRIKPYFSIGPAIIFMPMAISAVGSALHSNSLLLMVMLLWGQAGFSMVLLSAAIKDPRSSDAFPSRQSAPSHRPFFPLLGTWPRSIRLDGIM